MPNFAGLRFDDRILDRDDDGGAFERFVDEFLRLQSPCETLVLGLAKGRDGAIDIFDSSQNLTSIAECKFIGRNVQATASKRWGEVEGHLALNLPKVAVGRGAQKYRPWLKSQGSLKIYRFVTSAVSADVDERTQLHSRIREFFVEISNSHDELSHLKDIQIELLYWDDLVGKCSNFVPLFYRWFGGFPQGYGEISASFGASEAGFKRFLESSNLPYFSREDFDAQCGRSPRPRFESALEHLTKGDDGRALVISGPGGIGKTRLSIEICEAARRRGWWPIRLERKARVADLDELCRRHSEASNIVLFVDYAEAFEDLDRLPESLQRLKFDGRHTVSLVASTRSSSMQSVKDRLNGVEISDLLLRRSPEGDAYHSWVVDRILDHFQVRGAEIVAKSCSGLPVMAAFAAFLYRRHRARFDEQFANLAEVRDFSDWAATRLKSIEDHFKGRPVQRMLAELAVRLPMTMDETEAFRAASDLNHDLFEVLKADRWVEPDGDAFSAAHDVLADAMLARYLSAVPGGEQDRLHDLLFRALADDRLGRSLTVIDRLGQHSVFEHLSGRRAVEALARLDRSKMLTQLPVLAASRLLRPIDLIELLANSEDMREQVAMAPEAHLAIARAAEWAATKGRHDVARALAEAALGGPLSSAVGWPHNRNIHLRCAYVFDPARYSAAVLDRLAREPDLIDSHYLMVALLKGSHPPQEVGPLLEVWLNANAAATKASFVYRSWLDATGDGEAVRGSVLAWLAEHETKLEAQFVYSSWLDATGDGEAVRGSVLAWLAEHETKVEAQFVYKSWLDATGDGKAVRAPVLAWLAEHATIAEAQFVYRSWLDATGDGEAVRASVLAWLAERETKVEAQFVYRSWLDATGDGEAVRASVLAWLAEHETIVGAQFVYRSWLDATGDGEAVRVPVLAWLAEHETKVEAQFVYRGWLDATGDGEAVRGSVIAWLAEHGTKVDAQFVYRGWLEAGQRFEDIQEHCESWLAQHWQRQDAVYVTKALSSRWDLSFKTIGYIVAWAGHHARHEDAIFRLSRVSRAFNQRALVSRSSKLIAKATLAILEQMCMKNFLSKHEVIACLHLFGNFSNQDYIRDENWIYIIKAYFLFVNQEKITVAIPGIPKHAWAFMFGEALRFNFIDPLKDKDIVARATHLILQAMSQEELQKLAASGYFGGWQPD